MRFQSSLLTFKLYLTILFCFLSNFNFNCKNKNGLSLNKFNYLIIIVLLIEITNVKTTFPFEKQPYYIYFGLHILYLCFMSKKLLEQFIHEIVYL